MIFTHLCRVVALLGAIYGVFALYVSCIGGTPTQSELDLRHGLTVLFGSIALARWQRLERVR
jgi:hypothetical protein